MSLHRPLFLPLPGYRELNVGELIASDCKLLTTGLLSTELIWVNIMPSDELKLFTQQMYNRHRVYIVPIDRTYIPEGLTTEYVKVKYGNKIEPDWLYFDYYQGKWRFLTDDNTLGKDGKPIKLSATFRPYDTTRSLQFFKRPKRSKAQTSK